MSPQSDLRYYAERRSSTAQSFEERRVGEGRGFDDGGVGGYDREFENVCCWSEEEGSDEWK